MMKNEKLQKISDCIFQEIEPFEGKSKPCEWHRSLNFINLQLKNIKILTSYNLHDTNFDREEEKLEEPLKTIKADISEHIVIKGIVDDEQMQDSLYFAVEDEDNLFTINKISSKSNVSIKAGKPSKGNNRINIGVYYGKVFHIYSELSENDIYFDLTIPNEHLMSLISTLSAKPNSTVKVGVYLLSFTHEANNIHEEDYNSKDIIINKLAPCFLSQVDIITEIGQHN